MKRKYTIVAVGLTLFAVTIALALPYVDGALTPDSEYDGGDVQSGVYSECYFKYVKGEGLYVCNDWCDPNETYDPNDQCNGYNIFTWTDTQPTPWMYWRLKCPGDGSTPTIQKCPRDDQWNWQDVDPNSSGWNTAAGFHPSINSPVPHPIWEACIPPEAISEDILMGLKDPTSIDPNACPEGWDPPNFGTVPDFNVPDMQGDDDC